MSIVNLLSTCLFMNVFAYLTIRLRPAIYGVKLFKPMIWNFKLSLVPFLIQLISFALMMLLSALSAHFQINWLYYAGIVVFLILQLIWLVFLPNSTYLITELNLTHRQVDDKEVPIWYDIVSVLSFALSGIINTLVNIVILQLEILMVVDPKSITAKYQTSMFFGTVLLTIVVIIGVYLGRSIRFNTWDLLHPIGLIKKLITHIKKDGELMNLLLFVIFHTALLIILFLGFGLTNFFQPR